LVIRARPEAGCVSVQRAAAREETVTRISAYADGRSSPRRDDAAMEQSRHPQAGDIVAIHGHHVGEQERTGEVLEVLGEPGHEHFRVRWEDGHESVFYPSSDAVVRPGKTARSKP
jgi:Domain of unknown function (DUF1918)